MPSALLMAFGDPGRGLLLVGTDLSANHHDLLRAVEFLQHEDLVGPADDGGYWLIGLSEALLRQPARWPIKDIPWGSSTVLESTIERELLDSTRLSSHPGRTSTASAISSPG